MDRYHELRETHSNVRAALEYALGDPVESAVPAVPPCPPCLPGRPVPAG